MVVVVGLGAWGAQGEKGEKQGKQNPRKKNNNFKRGLGRASEAKRIQQIKLILC